MEEYSLNPVETNAAKHEVVWEQCPEEDHSLEFGLGSETTRKRQEGCKERVEECR